MSKKILVIGSTVADVIINLPVLPTTGGDINIYGQKISLGGCAHNVFHMAKHFGADVDLATPIGKGVYGNYVKENLDAKNCHSILPPAEEENGCCYCFVEDGGERTFVCNRGAEYEFKKEWLDSIPLEQYSYVYICGLELEAASGPILVDFIEKVANSGIKVFFAPSPRVDFLDASMLNRVLKVSDFIHVNGEELSFLAGAESHLKGFDEIKKGAEQLAARSKENAILFITESSKGSYFYEDAILVHAAPHPVDEIVDTIGAGDSHAGTVLASISLGNSLKDSLTNANKVAAQVVGIEGAVLPL